MDLVNATELSILHQLGDRGVKEAAIRLANLTGKQVKLNPPHVQLVTFDKISDFLGGADQLVCGIHLKIIGDITGSVLLIFPNDASSYLLNLWFEESRTGNLQFNPFEESALKELGNITMGAYLVALSELTGYTMLCSVPDLAVDMLGALLNEILVASATDMDQAVLIETEFSMNKELVKGFFLLIFDPVSIKKLLG